MPEKGIERVEHHEGAGGKRGYVVGRHIEQSGLPDIKTRLVEETDDGMMLISEDEKQAAPVESPKEGSEDSRKENTTKRRRQIRSAAEAQPQVVVQEKVIYKTPDPQNGYSIEVDTDFGTLVVECYDVSRTPHLLTLCYHLDIKGTKFLPKTADKSFSISIKELETGDLEEYNVVPLGISFILETTNLQCTLLEIVD